MPSSMTSCGVTVFFLFLFIHAAEPQSFYNPFAAFLNNEKLVSQMARDVENTANFTTTAITQATTTLAATTTEAPELDKGIYFQAGYSLCERYNDDGTTKQYLYDECTSFCCGGTVYRNKTGLDCCGSRVFGSPIWPRYQRCCEWWTGHGRAHPKSTIRSTVSCCGADLVFWGVQQCCYGEGSPPQVYDKRRHICCGSKRVSTRTMFPWQSKCCGEGTSYDHRLQSCPCSDGQVLNVPEVLAACCFTPDGLGKPYNIKYDLCCNGQVGKLQTHFCCGNLTLGKFGHQVCCDGKLKDLATPNDQMTECCAGEPYDPEAQVCCDNILMDNNGTSSECCGKTPFDPRYSICCDQFSLWSKELQGTECCGSFAFFPDHGLFCCDGETQVAEFVKGDACCGFGAERHYYYKTNAEFICCDGVLGFASSGDSCCGEYPFDTRNGICCNGEVFDRTLGDTCCNGSPYFVSKGTDRLKSICCELGPGGPFIQPSCCNGMAYDLNGGQVCCQGDIFGIYRQPACCVDVGYDVTTHQCCTGQIRKNPEGGGGRSRCCGDSVYDTGKQLCCNDVIIDVPEHLPIQKAQCCEQFDVYDPVNQLCCTGLVYNKTHRYASKCCGEMMYDLRHQKCCESEVDDITNPPVLYEFDYGRKPSKCCGNQLYDAKVDYCCEEIISPKIHEDTECCMGFPFDRRKQVCCEGQLQEIGDRVPWTKAECCGRECYYRGPQRCCMSRIYENNRRSYRTCSVF